MKLMNAKMLALSICLTLSALSVYTAQAEDWKPAGGTLLSKFAGDLDPAAPHKDYYPRPQLVRAEWENLNGFWDYSIQPSAQQSMTASQGKILVPFAVESSLSGVAKRVGKENNLWYKTRFVVPQKWQGKRIMMNFGAVDWRCEVLVNGKKVGGHQGGYAPFGIDITDALSGNGQQEMILKVWDPTTDGPQPIGKQHNNPNGIWYTPVTGIWQTVWMEPVSEARVTKVKPVFDLEKKIVSINIFAKNAEGCSVAIDGKTAPIKNGKAVIDLSVEGKKYWTPDTPVLYDFTAVLQKDGKETDRVNSYYALRKISLGKTEDGHVRLMLNNQFVFQHGPLDQGWWPDGLYSAPTLNALIYDIKMLKAFGFNMLRKHVKVEPAIYYYYCDKLGMLVWQDMPSGDPKHYIPPKAEKDAVRDPESVAIYEAELKDMIASFDFFPSIIVWVPFNEGWGQFDTPRIVEMVRALDDSRLVNGTSGWADRNCSDMHDMHKYPGPGMFPTEEKRASVLGEYGGLGLPIKGHSWKENGNWGYVSFDDKEGLFRRYRQLNRQLRPLILNGLSAAVYTQTTDVEVEVNGLMSYDRAVVKVPVEKMFQSNTKLRAPLTENAPMIKTVVATAADGEQVWNYTFAKPADHWADPNFNDSAWKKGAAGFGTEKTPGALVRTVWNTPEIWLRRAVDLSEDQIKNIDNLFINIHHDEDAEVYLNGIKIGSFKKYIGEYTLADPDMAALKKAAKPGKNILAVHCRQTAGGQYIDVGFSIEDATEK